MPSDVDFLEAERLSVRELGPADLDEVMRLMGNIKAIVFPPGSWEPYGEKGLELLLDPSHAYGLGLFCDAPDGPELVGTAFLVKSDTSLHGTGQLPLTGTPEKGTAEITHVTLETDWRGEGIAAGLVDDLMRTAHGMRGISRVYALVNPIDMQSRKLFERAQFVTCCNARCEDGQEWMLYNYWFEVKD